MNTLFKFITILLVKFVSLLVLLVSIFLLGIHIFLSIVVVLVFFFIFVGVSAFLKDTSPYENIKDNTEDMINWWVDGLLKHIDFVSSTSKYIFSKSR